MARRENCPSSVPAARYWASCCVRTYTHSAHEVSVLSLRPPCSLDRGWLSSAYTHLLLWVIRSAASKLELYSIAVLVCIMSLYQLAWLLCVMQWRADCPNSCTEHCMYASYEAISYVLYISVCNGLCMYETSVWLPRSANSTVVVYWRRTVFREREERVMVDLSRVWVI